MKIKENITQSLKSIDNRLAKSLANVSIPGFRKKSVYEVGRFFVKSLFVEDINLRASSMAFNFFLALFPAIIFLFTLIAFIPISNFDQTLTTFLENFLPPSAFDFLTDTIDDILKNQNSRLLSFGFIATLYFASNAFAGIIEAFDAGLSFSQQRSWLSTRLQSLQLMFSTVLLFITTILVSISLSFIVNEINTYTVIEGRWLGVMLQALNYLLTIFFVYLIFSTLYYFGSAKANKWTFFTPGSTLATFLSVAATAGFKSYVENFNSYNKLYGSIGTLLVLMVLIYFNSIVTLVGYELNRSIDKAQLEPRDNLLHKNF